MSWSFVWFLLFGLGVFSLSLVGYKQYRSTALYALAIGGVVNANFFHAVAYPVDCFGLPFGIDSLIYTLFAYCVMSMLLEQSRREAYLLAFSSIIAILFAACMQLAAELFSQGSSPAVWSAFMTFVASAFASTVAAVVAVEAVHRLKGRCSPYVCMACGGGLIALINSGIYYPLCIAAGASHADVGVYLLTSYMGKGIGLVYSLLAMACTRRIAANMAREK